MKIPLHSLVKGKKAVVTGGAGFIGSHLVDCLLGRGASVHVVDNLSTGLLENLMTETERRAGLYFRRVDILNRAALTEIMDGAHFVFHLATQNVRLSLRQPSWVSKVNVEGTLNVLEAAAEAKVERFLYCSSSEVNGTADVVPMTEDYNFRPETIYGASKLTGEYYTQVFHRSQWLNATIARPHNNYGPRAHSYGISEEIIPKFIMAALAGQDLCIYGSGHQTRDFTYVIETAECLIDLAESSKSSGETYNVCRGTEVSVLVLASKILELTKSKSRIVHVAARKNDVLRLFGDNSKLKNLFGRSPSVDIEDGLKMTIQWYKSRSAAWNSARSGALALYDRDTWPFEKWVPRDSSC